MDIKDRNYLELQFRLRIHEKNATEFQSFFESIMERAFSNFKKIRPCGRSGDGGNDGYRPEDGIYYQVYAPRNPSEKEAVAVKKLKEDFEKQKTNWDEISKIRTYYFVFNDKGSGSTLKIEKALAELKKDNQGIEFKTFTAKDLEAVFFDLSIEKILSLGFDIDLTKAVNLANQYLETIELDLDRENGAYALKTVEISKDLLSTLHDENLSLRLEILEARALHKLERIKEAREKYKDLCTRYPNDPRAFLYLAEIHIYNEELEKNEELLNQAEKIDSDCSLLKLEKLIREYQLGKQIDCSKIDEHSFPTDPRMKSNFYSIYSLFLERAGDQTRAESFIEKAIHLNPDKINNYHCKLWILGGKTFSQTEEKEEFEKRTTIFLSEINAVEQKSTELGDLSPRNQALLNFGKINVFVAQENLHEVEKLAKESFGLIMKCYFNQSIDKLLVGLLMLTEFPPKNFARLLEYLQGAEKAISDGLAKAIVFQFNLKDTLFTEGKKFFEAAKKRTILDFINNLENKKYDEVWTFLKEDFWFAVATASTAKQFPVLRKKIIENLPNDGSVQKEKLWLLLNYDEENIDEAFDLLKDLDLSKLSYFECKPILEIAKVKKAWDFEIKVLEKLLQYEKDRTVVLQLKLSLFTANLNLGRFPVAIEIGEKILCNSEEMVYLDDQNKENLLAQTVQARLKRGEYSQAKELLETHQSLSKTFEFKIGIEAEVYLRNSDAWKALTSVIEGVKAVKTPTPEQYGSLFYLFGEIANMIEISLTSQDKIEAESYVKFKDQDRWYFIGDKDELDATKVSSADEKYSTFLGKKIGQKVMFRDKYRSTMTEHAIENILPIEKYVIWQSQHHAQQLTLEHRWKMMEMIEVPKKGETIDTKYIIARLEDERKKRGSIFDLYCRENLPLAFLAVSEGGLTDAIGCITNENKGFIKFSSGAPEELNQQKEIAKKIISGEPFYIDGTSALVLSETGLLENIFEHLSSLKVPQSVITLLLETNERFRYLPGQIGHMGYAQGKLRFSSVDQEKRATLDRNFKNSLRVLEAKPQNVVPISAATKADCFTEQGVPAGLCDACILGQRDNVPVLTEDFLYLKANEMQTKKKPPEYCSAFALIRVLYEEKKITFDQYLNFFTYLSSYRFRFLPISTEDIERAVFGDGLITIVQPERIRQLNFPLTLSEEYGVPFGSAFAVVERFLLRVLVDDTILPEIVERIFIEILSDFPGNMDKRTLGKIFLLTSVKRINQLSKTVIPGSKVQKKIDLLSQLIQVYSPRNNKLICL